MQRHRVWKKKNLEWIMQASRGSHIMLIASTENIFSRSHFGSW